ncbi:MAG: hypothetical protein NTY67_07395 [Cyanobacteria bacterium]|nr:hypothetical protein [Cyanobacteriota bacterium]
MCSTASASNSVTSTVGRVLPSGHPQPEPLRPFPVLALFRRLLLLPLLSPLLAALLLAALNPRPSLSLRLLIWRTPELPLGLWIAAGAGGGALLSGSASALALRQGAASRRGGRGRRDGETTRVEASRAEPWSESWPETPARAAVDTREARRSAAASAGPQRAPGEPAPTVAVPYRVLHRPGASPAPAEAGAAVRTEQAPATRREAQPETVAVADDWAQSEADEW